jgi:hypothetical protein
MQNCLADFLHRNHELEEAKYHSKIKQNKFLDFLLATGDVVA